LSKTWKKIPKSKRVINKCLTIFNIFSLRKKNFFRASVLRVEQAHFKGDPCISRIKSTSFFSCFYTFRNFFFHVSKFHERTKILQLFLRLFCFWSPKNIIQKIICTKRYRKRVHRFFRKFSIEKRAKILPKILTKIFIFKKKFV